MTDRADTMPALTFWRPWAQGCASGAKTLEYRRRPPPKTLLGRELAIVAGQRFDASAIAWMHEHCGVDWRDRTPDSFALGIVGVLVITGWREDHANPAFGTYAWTLEHAALIVPLPWKGSQGVQYLPEHATRIVLARYAEAI